MVRKINAKKKKSLGCLSILTKNTLTWITDLQYRWNFWRNFFLCTAWDLMHNISLLKISPQTPSQIFSQVQFVWYVSLHLVLSLTNSYAALFIFMYLSFHSNINMRILYNWESQISTSVVAEIAILHSETPVHSWLILHLQWQEWHLTMAFSYIKIINYFENLSFWQSQVFF